MRLTVGHVSGWLYRHRHDTPDGLRNPRARSASRDLYPRLGTRLSRRPRLSKVRRWRQRLFLRQRATDAETRPLYRHEKTPKTKKTTDFRWFSSFDLVFRVTGTKSSSYGNTPSLEWRIRTPNCLSMSRRVEASKSASSLETRSTPFEVDLVHETYPLGRLKHIGIPRMRVGPAAGPKCVISTSG